MKKTAVLILSLLTVVFSVNAAEISEQSKAILQQIEKANESLTTITSQITETRKLQNGKQFISNGVFYFSHPNLLAIYYTEPQGDYLVINTEEIAQEKEHGRSFNVSLKRNESVRTLSTTLLWGISGKLISLAEANDAIVTTTESNGMINVVFVAQGKKAKDFKQIELNYDKASMQIKSLTLIDKNKVVTTYTMKDAQYGVSIDPSVFVIK
jgi:outer membrane lipoprotein-sorting protein